MSKPFSSFVINGTKIQAINSDHTIVKLRQKTIVIPMDTEAYGVRGADIENNLDLVSKEITRRYDVSMSCVFGIRSIRTNHCRIAMMRNPAPIWKLFDVNPRDGSLSADKITDEWIVIFE